MSAPEGANGRSACQIGAGRGRGKGRVDEQCRSGRLSERARHRGVERTLSDARLIGTIEGGNRTSDRIHLRSNLACERISFGPRTGQRARKAGPGIEGRRDAINVLQQSAKFEERS